MNRYFLASEYWSEDLLTLTGDEAKHCAQVMRESVGAVIEIFDGVGISAHCEILSCGRNEVQAKILETIEHDASERSVHLLQAIPKGKNMEWIVQKAVELGVDRISPMVTKHSVVKITSDDDALKKQEKWQRVALEACKQCGQNWLVQIDKPQRFDQVFEGGVLNAKCFVASLEEGTQPLRSELDKLTQRDVVVAVGPEGDFSELEYECLRELKFTPVSLGKLVLRVETATFLMLGALAIL